MYSDINDCEPNPCINGATCEDGVDFYQCNCQPGYTGKTCQTGISTLIIIPFHPFIYPLTCCLWSILVPRMNPMKF